MTVDGHEARTTRPEIWRILPRIFTARACRGCGRPISWVPGKDQGGKPAAIPLDITTMRPAADGTGAWEARSHFQTCPRAASFSRRKEKR